MIDTSDVREPLLQPFPFYGIIPYKPVIDFRWLTQTMKEELCRP